MSIATSTAIIGGAALAAGGGIAAAVIGSNAAQSAGQAQLSAAQMQVQLAQQALQAQIQARQQGIQQAQSVSQMSASEMQSIQQMLTTQGQSLNSSLASISQQQGQLNAMNPEIQASGQNLYNLLTGQSAAILAPLQQQQQIQRNQLVQQLQGQLGPGYMTSSAGIQALTQFDNQAAITLNSAQMNAIQTVGAQYGSLAGMQNQGQNAVTGATLGAYGQALTTNAAVTQAYQANTALQTNATLGAMSANPLAQGMVPNAQSSVVQTAGNPYAGQAVLGQGIGQATSALGAGAGQLAGYGMYNNLLGNLGSATNNGGVGTNLSSSIGNYQIPSINPAFGSMIGGSGGGYNANLGAATTL